MAKKLQFGSVQITPEQAKFCTLFVSEGEFFGNGTQSYIEAYDVDLNKPNAYQTARAKASQLLTKGSILKRINELLEDVGLNDQNVDKQLFISIQQNADFGSKIRAIGEYNKLKKRIQDADKDPVKVVVEIKQVP